MEGAFSEVQKFLVKAILDHIDDMTKRIKDLDDIIDDQMKTYQDEINKLDELPGIGKRSAKSAKKDKNSFFHAQYQRLVVRRGANRATVAVAHSMLIAIYHMLKDKVSFKDLGSDYYTKFNTEKKANYYLKKLQELGASLLRFIFITMTPLYTIHNSRQV